MWPETMLKCFQTRPTLIMNHRIPNLLYKYLSISRKYKIDFLNYVFTLTYVSFSFTLSLSLSHSNASLKTNYKTIPSPDRDLARDRYGEQFSLMFQAFDEEDAVSVESDREYASLFILQHSYITDTVRAVDGSSSAFKASTFCSTFIHPTVHYPFLDSTLLNYKE